MAAHGGHSLATRSRDVHGSQVGVIQGNASITQNYGLPQEGANLANAFLETLYDDAARLRLYKISKKSEKTFEWILSDDIDHQMSLSFGDKKRMLREELKLNDAEFKNYWETVPLDVQSACLPHYDQLNHVSLMDWAKVGHGIFWIWGKPGCGKSTLMKYLWNDATYKNALDASSAIIAQHFFWRAGSSAQQSELTFFASILHQILSKRLDLLDTAFDPIVQKSKVSKWKLNPQSVWIVEELTEALADLFNSNPSETFYLHIDGLDECEGEGNNLATILKDFEHYPNVKMLVSGRRVTGHWVCFDNAPTIPMHLITWQDTIRFVIGTCTKNPAFNKLPDNLREYWRRPVCKKDLMLSIIAKSEGVLLWTAITVKEVIRRAILHQSLEKIDAMIYEAPREIFPLYESLLESLPPDHLADASSWLLLASEGVSAPAPFCANWKDWRHLMNVKVLHLAGTYEYDNPLWLRHASDCDPDRLMAEISNTAIKMERRCPHFFSIEKRPNYKDMDDDDLTEWQSKPTWCIDFMHRTAADFVRNQSVKLRAAAKFTDNLRARLLGAAVLAQAVFGDFGSPIERIESSDLRDVLELCGYLLSHAQTIKLSLQIYHHYLCYPRRVITGVNGEPSEWLYESRLLGSTNFVFDIPPDVSDRVLALNPFIRTQNFQLVLLLSRELQIQFTEAERYWIVATAIWAPSSIRSESWGIWMNFGDKGDRSYGSDLRALISGINFTQCKLLPDPEMWMDILLIRLRDFVADPHPEPGQIAEYFFRLRAAIPLLLESGARIDGNATVALSDASCETARTTLLSLIRRSELDDCSWNPSEREIIKTLIESGARSRVIRRRRWSFPMIEQTKAFTEEPHFDQTGSASSLELAWRRAKNGTPCAEDEAKHLLDYFRGGKLQVEEILEKPAFKSARRRSSLSVVKDGSYLEQHCAPLVSRSDREELGTTGAHSDWKELQHVLHYSGLWEKSGHGLDRSPRVPLSEYGSFVSSSSYLRFEDRAVGIRGFGERYSPYPIPRLNIYMSFWLARYQLRTQGDFFPEPVGRFSSLLAHLAETTNKDRTGHEEIKNYPKNHPNSFRNYMWMSDRTWEQNVSILEECPRYFSA